VMTGYNSRLVRQDGRLVERVWREGGLYGSAISRIIHYLEKARPFADSEQQQHVIDKLVEFYRTGDLRTFDDYSILWLKNTGDRIDFVNGFIETYNDPLGLKGAWESIVNFKDLAATARTEKLSANAQWFEDNSPVDARFKKAQVKGISAKVITAAMLAGDLYPSTAIGINLPNSDWVRRDYGSKSVTISNLFYAYKKNSQGSGALEEFVIDKPTRELIEKYGDITDDLHTDLHECLGHGSGQLLPGTDPDSLKAYSSTIEEGRADLFALYYLADPKLTELGLTPNADAYKRAILQLYKVVELVKRNGKTYVRINDYPALRRLFGDLLAEVQRIKSEGDYAAARDLVETYGVANRPRHSQRNPRTIRAPEPLALQGLHQSGVQSHVRRRRQHHRRARRIRRSLRRPNAALQPRLQHAPRRERISRHPLAQTNTSGRNH